MQRFGKRMITAAVLSQVAVLAACSQNGNPRMEAAMAARIEAAMAARPVCIKPHGGANVQLAPMYQCEQKMSGTRLYNG